MTYTRIPKFSELTLDAGGCVFKSDLTSLASINAGGAAATAVGSPTFSAAGVTYPTVGDRVYIQLSLAKRNEMVKSTMVGFTVSKDALDNTNTLAIENYFFNTNAGAFSFKRAAGTPQLIYAVQGTNSDPGAYRYTASESGLSKVVVVRNGKWITVYIDDFPEINTARSSALITAAEFAIFYIGGRSNGNPSVQGYPMKDFFIIAGQTLCLPILPRLRHINVYGDSKPALGQYRDGPTPATDYQTILSRQEDPFCSIATNVNYDDKLFPVIHRELNKRGLYLGNNRLHSWAESGNGFIHPAASGRTVIGTINQSLIGKYPVPTVVILDCATNDYQDAAVPIDATWKNAVLAAMNAFVAVGVPQIIVCTQTEIQNADHSAKTTAGNDFLKTLPAIYPQVRVVDIFTLAGGFNTPASYFTDGIHPSVTLEILKGKWIADAID